MDEQAIRFRLGVFVLAGLLLLAVLITLFGGFPNYLKPSSNFTIVFGNAPGVSRGTPVRRSGVKIGEVSKLTLDNDTGNVEVEIQVDPGFTLRKGDRPTLVQGLLGGDTAIAFLPPEGQPVDKTPVEPGSVLVGETQADTGTVLQQTAKVLPPAEEALAEAKVVFQKIDKMTPLMEETFKEFRDVARAIRESLPEVRRTADELRELSKTTRQLVPDFRKTNDEIQLTARSWSKLGERANVLLQTNEDKLVKTLDEVELVVRRLSEVLTEENQKYFRDTLRNLRNGTNNLEEISRNTESLLKETRDTLKQFNNTLLTTDRVMLDVEKATRPLAERGESILRNVDESAEKLNRTLTDLREVLASVTRNDGSFQRLLNDPALFNNLNEAASGLNRMMPRMDHILRDVEIFADKIARHPESLGVGGVVRPGSGIKESPTPYRIIPTHP